MLAPESFARKSALLAFIIDPFRKTNDTNYDNNIVFAWINLQTTSKGESPHTLGSSDYLKEK